MTLGFSSRKCFFNPHTRIVSGRMPVITEAREGLQMAIWQCALANTVPRAPSASMCGVTASLSPNTPTLARRSSTAMNNTFGRSAACRTTAIKIKMMHRAIISAS